VQRFERTYGETIELSSRSQIYTALDSLVRRGLIEHAQGERVDNGLRQPKPHYRASQVGICAYERWLIEQVCEDERRSRLIAQHFAALPGKHALRLLERCSEACLEAAGRLDRVDDDDPRPEGSGALAERLAGEEERLRVGATLSWIEYACSELRATAERTRR
jgi:DNA-binding PadR family transcriptional regulator